MKTEPVNRIVACPACSRTGWLSGTLTVSGMSGDWLSFAADHVPAGFVLVSNSRIRLTCTCGTVAWPRGAPD